MTAFAAGMCVGAVIGATVAVFVMSAVALAKRADERSEEQARHREIDALAKQAKKTRAPVVRAQYPTLDDEHAVDLGIG